MLTNKLYIYIYHRSKAGRQVQESLHVAGYCCLWVPEFAEIPRPLYTSTKGGGTEPLIWTETKQKTKEVLTQTLGYDIPVQTTGLCSHRMARLSKI